METWLDGITRHMSKLVQCGGALASATQGGRGKKKVTYLKFLVHDVALSIVSAFSQIEVTLETLVILSEHLVEVVLELLNNGLVLVAVLVHVRLLQHLIHAALGELLQCRLESMGNSLISGLEVPLTLVGSLDARVGKVLCPTSSRASTTRLGGRSL